MYASSNLTIIKWYMCIQLLTIRSIINPFFPNVPFLYPLKISENIKVFWWFQWVEKNCNEKKCWNNLLKQTVKWFPCITHFINFSRKYFFTLKLITHAKVAQHNVMLFEILDSWNSIFVSNGKSDTSSYRKFSFEYMTSSIQRRCCGSCF